MLGSSEWGTLHFALLGPPQVYLDGRLLMFPSRKALALLLYLADVRWNRANAEERGRRTLSDRGGTSTLVERVRIRDLSPQSDRTALYHRHMGLP